MQLSTSQETRQKIKIIPTVLIGSGALLFFAVASLAYSDYQANNQLVFSCPSVTAAVGQTLTTVSPTTDKTAVAKTLATQRAKLTATTSNFTKSYATFQKNRTAVNKNSFRQQAMARKTALVTAMKTDPDTAWKMIQSISTKDRKTLAKITPGCVEQLQTIKGRTSTIAIDSKDSPSESTYLYTTPKDRHPVQLSFANRIPSAVTQNNVQLLVTGYRLDNTVVINGAKKLTDPVNPSLETSGYTSGTPLGISGTVAPAIGEQKTLVIMVNYPLSSATSPTASDQKQYLFDDPSKIASYSVNQFFYDSSYQKTWLKGDIFGWYDVKGDNYSDPCETQNDQDVVFSQTVDQSLSKFHTSNPNVDIAQYSHILVFASSATNYFSSNNKCVGALSDIGRPAPYSTPNDTSYGNLQIPRTVIFTFSDFNSLQNTNTIAHELGHSMGLSHASYRDCAQWTANINSNCYVNFPEDPLDLMGYGTNQQKSPPQPSAYRKDQLGWLDDSNVVTMKNGETKTIKLSPLEKITTNEAQAIIIPRNNTDSLYLEFRQPLFSDTVITNAWAFSGALVHAPGSGYTGLLSGYPFNLDRDDAVLVIPGVGNNPLGNNPSIGAPKGNITNTTKVAYTDMSGTFFDDVSGASITVGTVSGSGENATLPVTVRMPPDMPDYSPPSITVVSPPEYGGGNFKAYNGTVPIVIQAKDISGVQSISIHTHNGFADDKVLASTSQPPHRYWTAYIDTALLPIQNGLNTISVVATDKKGNTNNSIPLSFLINVKEIVVPPGGGGVGGVGSGDIIVSYPLRRATIPSGTVTFFWKTVGYDQVDVWVDGQRGSSQITKKPNTLSGTYTPPFVLTPGQHSLWVVGYSFYTGGSDSVIFEQPFLVVAPSVGISAAMAHAPLYCNDDQLTITANTSSINEGRIIIDGSIVQTLPVQSTGATTQHFNANTVSEGDHQLHVELSLGKPEQWISSNSIPIHIQPDQCIPPTISISQPSEKAITHQSLKVVVSNPSRDVDHVDYSIDGTVVQTVQNNFHSYCTSGIYGGLPPCNIPYQWDTTSVPDGTHSISVQAFNASGVSTSVLTRMVIVDNKAPTNVTVQQPSSGAALCNNTTPLSTTVSDLNLDRVEWYKDGTGLIATTQAPALCTVSSAVCVPAVKYGMGASGTSTTAALNAAKYDCTSTPACDGSWAGCTGETKVNYQAGTKSSCSKVGVQWVCSVQCVVPTGTTYQQAGASLTASWNISSVPSGNYSITAKAIDKAGNATTSAPVTVGVNQNVCDVPPVDEGPFTDPNTSLL